jgi:dTMP kinase
LAAGNDAAKGFYGPPIDAQADKRIKGVLRMPERGLLIVLEGSDGAGKATQFNLLGERLKAAGYDVSTFDFPRYSKDSSYFVRQYLNGQYGSAADISPYTASLFYALDRYEASKDIRKEVEAGKVVLINRYVGSNMAFQGAKFDDPVEQRGFFVWEDNLEFQLLNIPRPDINIFLRVPAEISRKLIKDRSARTGVALDEHEKDEAFLKKSLITYDLLCQLFPKDFTAIECTKDEKLLSIPQISNLIWEKLKPLLPNDRPHAGHSSVVTLSSVKDQPSHSGNHINDDKLVQDFKNASLLLKLNIERQVKSIDPPGISVWSDFDYKFYTPMGLPKKVEASYKLTMERLGELHRQMRVKLEQYYERTLLSGSGFSPNTSQLLQPVTPLAALCNFKAVLSERAVSRVSSNLLASDSQELQWAAQQLYLAAKQTWPGDFKNPLESAGSPEPINNIIAKLAEDKLSLNSGDKDQVKLLEAAPRQEFDLLAESIYPYSSLSLDEISEEVSNWSYQQKYESLKQAAADQTILEKIKYKFDVVTDQITLAEALDASMLGQVQVQTPSPRFGYDVPQILDEAGIDELYLECFDESLKLFSILQQADRDDLTVYATLLGHKLRWQFSADAKNLALLFEHKSSENYTQLIESLKETAAEVHPLTWEVLSAPAKFSPPAAKNHQNRVKPSRRPKKSRKSSRPKDK